uniref:Uncharacterized protein n=1 Tax=Arion vulgaris TaxID=1028688 RepID=A0A0B7ACT5_9EUPU
MEKKWVFLDLVQRTFHSCQGHEKGQRSPTTAKRNPRTTEDGIDLLRDRMGHY